MSNRNTPGLAELLIELSKKINIRKYLKRETLCLQSKSRSVIQKSSILNADLNIYNYQIGILREHIHKTAVKILKVNKLTINNIAPEEFELPSASLLNGYVDLQSTNPDRMYFYSVLYGIILPNNESDTPDQKMAVKKLRLESKSVPNLGAYSRFINILPF